MNNAYVKAGVALAVAAMLMSLIPVCLAQDTDLSYKLLNSPDGKTIYQLEVVIPQQLNNYYSVENHRLYSSSDFAKFITPYALKPIADRLGEIYDSDEDFANGVLEIVHQITYEETLPGYYPTETIARGTGDCDLFAYIAASIMKAGGLNIVLFYYENKEHMNIGVALSNPPTDNRGTDYYVEYNGVTYYMAECTGGNWKTGWRVGECPDDYKDISTQVISLTNVDRVDPGQVSASFSVMESSTLSLDVTPFAIISGNSNFTFKGQITPQLENQNVTIYAKINMSPWGVIGSTLTKADGSYEFTLQSQTGGLYAIQTSWAGDEEYTGALSETKNALLLPTYMILLFGTALTVVCIGGYFLVQRGLKRKTSIVPQTAPNRVNLMRLRFSRWVVTKRLLRPVEPIV
jgi:hypothetical protein